MMPDHAKNRFYLKERNFRRWYAVIAGLTLIIMAGVLTVNWQNQKKKMEFQLQEDMRQAETASQDYYKDFQSIMRTISVQTSRLKWVIKMLPDLPQLKQEYGIRRQQEIAEEYNLLCVTDTRLASVGVLFPYQDSGVISSIWVSAERALKVAGLKDGETDGFLKRLTQVTEMQDLALFEMGGSFSKRVVIVCPQENTANPRGYICFFVHVDQMLRQFEDSLRSESLAGYRLLRENGDLLGERNPAGDTTVRIQVPGLNWSLTLYFRDSLAPFGYSEQLKMLILTFVLASIILCIGIYWALWFLYRPLSVFIGWIGQKTSNGKAGNYEMVLNYISGIDDEDRMSQRRKLLYDVLQGDYEAKKYGEDILEMGVHIENGKWYQVYLLDMLQNGFMGQLTHALHSLKSESPVFKEEFVKTDSGDLVLLLQFNSQKDAIQVNERIKTGLRRTTDWREGARWYMGMIVKDISGIPLSYRYAVKRRTMHAGDEGERLLYYYPLEWEKRFMEALSSGNADSIAHILDEIRRENERRVELGRTKPENVYMLQCRIEETIIRFISEEKIASAVPYIQIDSLSAADSLEDCWIYIENACMTICSIIGRQNEQPTDSASREILDFVDRNLADQQMSLKYLSDQFKMSINMINQVFKLATGNTFYVYLTRIRLEKACQLLRGTDLPIGEIAEATGYASMLSFRRAFAREMGVTPKMYRESRE